MPERSSKRKARRESITSSIDEPECSSMRTGNVPSISDKVFADLSEKIEKSVNKRIKDTETGQREILKMIENNLSSKIDSMTDETSCDLNQGLNGVNSENVILETRPIKLNEFCQDVSQHMVTGVSPQTEIPPRSSCLPPLNQKYPDHILDKLLESLRNVTQQNIRLPRLPKALSTTMPTFNGRNDKFEHFEDFFMTSLKVYPNISQ